MVSFCIFRNVNKGLNDIFSLRVFVFKDFCDFLVILWGIIEGCFIFLERLIECRKISWWFENDKL